MQGEALPGKTSSPRPRQSVALHQNCWASSDQPWRSSDPVVEEMQNRKRREAGRERSRTWRMRCRAAGAVHLRLRLSARDCALLKECRRREGFASLARLCEHLVAMAPFPGDGSGMEVADTQAACGADVRLCELSLLVSGATVWILDQVKRIEGGSRSRAFLRLVGPGLRAIPP